MGDADLYDWHVDEGWLQTVRGGAFYYPASGQDIMEPIRCFSEYLQDFHFCDIGYQELDRLEPALRTPPFRISYSGPRKAALEWRIGYRHLIPGKRVETYERPHENPINLVRRRGFGQMGLAEFPKSTISVFMHRGDSTGEGGSNLWFFSDRDSRHPPLSRVFSTLQSRLRDRALIITDGSNTWKEFLRRYHGSELSSREAYLEHRGKIYTHGQLKWKCVGWLSRRYGPTLVWGVTKVRQQQSFSSLDDVLRAFANNGGVS